jgi:hypothetical protein
MHSIMEYYCWIKQVRAEVATQRKVNQGALNRPPPLIASEFFITGKPKTSNAEIARDAKRRLGANQGPQSALSVLPIMPIGWALEAMFPSASMDVVFEYEGVYASREDALAFRKDPTHDWFADAEQSFLMRLDYLMPVAVDPDHPAYPPAPVQTEYPAYDADAWDPNYKAEAYRSTYFLGRDWTEGIDLMASLKGQGPQCDTFQTKMDEWDVGDTKTYANRENYSAAQCARTLFEAVGKPDPYKSELFNAIEFVTRMFEETTPPLSYYKQKYNVQRPHLACAKPGHPIMPKLPVPGHASFPSGHATQAWLVALALSSHRDMEPKKAKLEAAAEGIADRRVIAGLHYPMDKAAGKLLAQKLLARLLDNPNQDKRTEFRTLLDNAVQELKD